MMEGNENNPDVVLEQQEAGESSQKPDELEHVFVIILLGLLGIGAFLMIMMFPDKEKVVGVSSEPLSNEQMTSPENYSDIPGRDPAVLGLSIHKEKGRFYTHPSSGMTLYFNKSGICGESCLENFEPFEPHIDDGYIASGVTYYLYKHDILPGDTFGENFDGVWIIARP